MVGLDGVEPSTSRLSGVRSNQTELQAPGDLELRIDSLSSIPTPKFKNPKSNWAHYHIMMLESTTWSLKTK